MRQDLLASQASLEERQRELQEAEEARHLLEDSLEDANTEMDALRRELDKLSVDIEENNFRLQEADSARKQVQEELLRYQEAAEQDKVSDLRDQRLRTRSRPLDMDAVAGGSVLGKLLPLVVGAGLSLAALEVLSFLAGRGELIGSLVQLIK